MHVRSVSMMTTFNNVNHNSLEKPVKSGWLKKQQRSIVRNWQQKYFALKGQYLYYYKEEVDVKPQGCLFLPRSTVNEVSSNPEDVGKFIFEIIPGTSTEQNKPISDSYVLMANSQSEMEEWVKALKKAAGVPPGVVFGQRLADTIIYEKKFGRHPVPILMEKCADFIREHGLNEEGIFRLPGQDNLVKQLKEAFDAGERPSFSRDTDVHTVASLFKLYLRELPEPVIPCSQYEDFLTCEKTISNDEEQGDKELIEQISLLPKDNYNLLSFICRFLNEVEKYSGVNKMSVDNLAMVIGVNLLKPQTEDPEIIMRGTPQIQKLMTVMISKHEKLFPKINDLLEESTRPKSMYKKAVLPRSSVGWDAAEESALSPIGDLTKRPLGDTSDSYGSSVLDAQLSPLKNTDIFIKDHGDSWETIPRKRTQTIPITLSYKQGESNGTSCKGDIFNSEFFSPTTGREGCNLFTTPGHKRTLSEEYGSNRKSAYDNVPFSQGESLNCSCPCPVDVESRSSKEEKFGRQNSNNLKHNIPNSETISKDCTSHGLSSNLADLYKEMEVQNKELEERIQSLEKDNFDVWKKVVKLNEELEKERNTRAALEIKLRNIERSRDDAEKRNKRLEEEIQGFVKAMSKAGTKSE
ncbi:rho GTPase-activating protein 25 isoform X2 [Bombina bombina]|uniref:rho GTPase-activating protein 25 isoform X2 n=1 Tax=Bombina bombina TaxID=8345 RepID=UPI00235ADA4A|nr:rho GTPase-activating protein 25 isoform X2 [Bombina bombina]